MIFRMRQFIFKKVFIFYFCSWIGKTLCTYTRSSLFSSSYKIFLQNVPWVFQQFRYNVALPRRKISQSDLIFIGLTWERKNWKSQSGFDPTPANVKWFEVNNIETEVIVDSPIKILNNLVTEYWDNLHTWKVFIKIKIKTIYHKTLHYTTQSSSCFEVHIFVLFLYFLSCLPNQYRLHIF
jgi:hypothetical protein